MHNCSHPLAQGTDLKWRRWGGFIFPFSDTRRIRWPSRGLQLKMQSFSREITSWLHVFLIAKSFMIQQQQNINKETKSRVDEVSRKSNLIMWTLLSYFNLCLKSGLCLFFFSLVTRVIPSLPLKQTCSQMQRNIYKRVNNFRPFTTHLSAWRKVQHDSSKTITWHSLYWLIGIMFWEQTLSAKAEFKLLATRAALTPDAFAELGRELSPTL